MVKYYDPLSDAEKNNKTNFFISGAAGILSGLIKVPEGVFSLAAELFDLGADTETAASVEEFFDKINPFEEVAEEIVIEEAIVEKTKEVIEEEIDGTDQPKYFDSMRRALDNVTSQVAGLNDPSMTALIDGQRSSLRAKMNEYKKAVPDEQQKTARDMAQSLSATFKETLKPGDVVTYETANGGTATRIWTGDRYI